MKATLFLGLRSLAARPGRTILTTCGVVLGVALVFAISITNTTTLQSINSVFEQAAGKAQLTVMAAAAGSQGFSGEYLSRTASTPGVRVAAPSVQGQAALADDGQPADVNINLLGAFGGAGMLLYGVDPTVDPQVRVYKLVAGEFLSPDDTAYDIVLVQDYADEKELRLGKDVRLLVAGRAVTFHVVGLIAREGPGQLNNGAFGVVPLRVAQDVFYRGSRLDQIDVVAQGGGGAEALETLRVALQERLGDRLVVTYPAAQGQRVAQMLDFFQLGLNLCSLIGLFAGGFLIYNAFSMTVAERTREIGMLRAIGMTRGQVMRQVLVEAALVGAGGSLAGLGAGILLARGLIRGMELLLAQDLRQLQVTRDGLILSLALGIGVTLVVAVSPARQAGRLPPIEALRSRSQDRRSWLLERGWTAGLALVAVSIVVIFAVDVRYEQAWLPNGALLILMLGAILMIAPVCTAIARLVGPVAGRLWGREGQVGSRNAQRAPLRTALTAATLSIAVAITFCLGALTRAWDDELRAWTQKYIGGDLYVFASSRLRAEQASRLMALPAVAAVTPVRYFDVRRVKAGGGSESLAFMAIDPSSYSSVSSFVFASGQGDPQDLLAELAAGDTVFISTVLGERYGLQRGDYVRLQTGRGLRDFRIAASVVDFYNEGLVIEGSWVDMRRYFGFADVSLFLIKLRPGADPAAAQTSIEGLYRDTHRVTVASNRELRSHVMGLLAGTSGMFNVLALIVGIVAAFGVINTLTMSVLERTREIGMLRSVGMTRPQVRKMILAEAGMMGVVGSLYGLPFGVLLSRSILETMNSQTGIEIAFIAPWPTIVISLSVALVLSQLAAIWPARRAARLSVVQAIQFE